ncbi:MAG: nucleotidyltransferase domain-containing protein [Deltaproteobacteria bacterium]|nr:nucleotidyltransferase domain-containing protein [Deltaproteobacteria bacterium]
MGEPSHLLPIHATRLRQLGVTALYLFGSRALAQQGPLSDYDYAVLLPAQGHQRGDRLYHQLYDLLTEISPRTLTNDVIDIVFLRDAPLELQFHVIRHGQVLFDVDPLARLRFEERTMLLYCDYRPVLDAFDKAILQSL